MNCLQVLNDAGSSQIEQVLAQPQIASLVALAIHEVGEPVLHTDSLPQLGTALWGLDFAAQQLLPGLIQGDAERATTVGGGVGALAPQGTGAAARRLHVHDLSQLDRLALSSRTSHGHRLQVDRKVFLSIQSSIVADPRSAQHRASGFSYRLGQRAVQVRLIDLQLGDL